MTDQKIAEAAVCLLLESALKTFNNHNLEATEEKLLRAMELSDRHLNREPSRDKKFIWVFKLLSELKEFKKEGRLQWPG